jgi:protein-disulfide isomerase
MLLLFTFNVAPVEGGHRLKPMVAVVASIVGIGFAGYGAYVFTGGQRYSAEKVMINQAVLAEMTPEEIAPPTAHRRGSIGGPVKLVVLADLACAGCADLHRRLESLTTGLKGIEWVFRHRPLTMLPGHEASGLGAVCAEIAGEKGKFWEFVDAVYGGNEEPSEAVYRNELLQLGIKDDPIKRFNNPKDPATMRAQADLAFAGKLSIISTPTIIILVKGLKPIGANAHTLTKTMQRDDIASVLAEANPQ